MDSRSWKLPFGRDFRIVNNAVAGDQGVFSDVGVDEAEEKGRDEANGGDAFLPGGWDD